MHVNFLKNTKLMQATVGFWKFLKEMGDDSLDAGIELLAKASVEDVARYVRKHVVAAKDYLAKTHNIPTAEAEHLLSGIFYAMNADAISGASGFLLRAKWYDCGLPTLQLGHKLAASYMATTMSADVINAVKSPFNTFALELPSDMLHVKDHMAGNDQTPLQSVLLGKLPNRDGRYDWMYVAISSGYANLWMRQPALSGLVKPVTAPLDQLQSAFTIQLDDEESRTSELLGRLLICSMLHMTDGGDVRQIGKGHSSSNPRRTKSTRDGEEPIQRVFVLTRDIKHDMRPMVRDYLGGTRDSLAVQSVVSGAWKMQPHGPRSTLRKQIFVEPYWRGPKDAPIVARAHVLG